MADSTKPKPKRKRVRPSRAKPKPAAPTPAAAAPGDAADPAAPAAKPRSKAQAVRYSAAVLEQITTAMKLGAGVEQAAAYAGVTRQSLYNWLKSKSKQYQALQHEVELAKGSRAIGWLQAIQLKATSADKDGWKAAAWLLERTLPDQFGPRGQLALTRGQDTQPDVAELEAAAARGVTLADGAVLWQRQLTVLEQAYRQGQLDAGAYLEGMNRLAGQAARLAELRQRQDAPAGLPQVQLAFTLDSPGVLDAADLPDGVELPGRAKAGGDLIDAG